MYLFETLLERSNLAYKKSSPFYSPDCIKKYLEFKLSHLQRFWIILRNNYYFLGHIFLAILNMGTRNIFLRKYSHTLEFFSLV